jgi:hypothetical protein
MSLAGRVFERVLGALHKTDPAAAVAQAFEAALVAERVQPCMGFRVNEDDDGTDDWHAARAAAVRAALADGFPEFGLHQRDDDDRELILFDRARIDGKRIDAAYAAHYDCRKGENIHDLHGCVWRTQVWWAGADLPEQQPAKLSARVRVAVGGGRPQTVGLIQHSPDDTPDARARMAAYEAELARVARLLSPRLAVSVRVRALRVSPDAALRWARVVAGAAPPAPPPLPVPPPTDV